MYLVGVLHKLVQFYLTMWFDEKDILNESKTNNGFQMVVLQEVLSELSFDEIGQAIPMAMPEICKYSCLLKNKIVQM